VLNDRFETAKKALGDNPIVPIQEKWALKATPKYLFTRSKTVKLKQMSA